MKILELNIVEFGALKNKKIEFDQGLNIVYGNNEAGKSTIVLFIKFMLYGLPRKSSKGGERERSLSLDGGRAAGTMTFEMGGERYFLERACTSGGRRGETARLTNLLTGESFNDGIAERIIGVPQEVFEGSVLIGQMRASDIKGEQLSTAIDNMLLSADESVDVSAILRKIDEVRKEYKLNRGDGGRLYESEKRIGELSSRRSAVMEKYLEAQRLSARLERTRKSIQKTEESYAQSKQLLDDVLGARLILRFDELADKKSELEGCSLSLAELDRQNAAKDFLPDRSHAAMLESALNLFESKRAQAAEREREAQKATNVPNDIRALADVGKRLDGISGTVLARVHKLSKKKKSFLGSAVALDVLAILLAAAGFALLGAFAMYVYLALFCGAALSAVLSAPLFVASAKCKKQRDEECVSYGVTYENVDSYFAKCAEALAACRAADSENALLGARVLSARADRDAAKNALCTLLEKTKFVPENENEIIKLCREEALRVKQFCEQRESIAASICALEAYVKGLEAELAEHDEAELRASVKTDPASLTPKVVEGARMRERYDRERLEKLRLNERNEMITLAGIRTDAQTPTELADQIELCRQRLASDTEYFDALMLAKEHIERASTQMSKNVTPEISRRAGELVELVSGGVHSTLQTNKTLDVSVENKGFLMSSELLSGGARDAVYICLRMALAEKIFDGEQPPLVLDESLCQLDDIRASRILSLLAELSSTVQCIIFTCHMRETELCKSAGAEFKLHVL